MTDVFVKLCCRFTLIILLCAAPWISAFGTDNLAADFGLNSQQKRDLSDLLLAPASIGYLPDDIRTHLKNSNVATALAVAVDPDNSQAWTLRAELLATLGDFKRSAECSQRAIELLNWQDHEGSINWLGYSLAALPTSEARQKMLDSVISNTKMSAALRAEALVNLALIMEGRGLFDKARECYRKALVLDEYQSAAVHSLIRLNDTPTLVENVRNSLRLLGGNPKAVNVVWELGMLCRDVGLYERAVRLYDYAAAVTAAAGGYAGDEYRRDHMDALLDAGQYDRVVKMSPDSVSGLLDLPMAGAVVEAYRNLGDTVSAEKLIARMKKEYAPQETLARSDGVVAAKMAWFNYYYRNSNSLAGNWVDMAMTMSPTIPLVKRIWSLIYLEDESRREEVKKTLGSLSGQDVFALAGLISLSEASGSDTPVLLEQLNTIARRGSGWRYAMRMLDKSGLSRPQQHESAAPIAKMVDDFFATSADEMALRPQDFIAFEISPVRKEFQSGQPLEVTVSVRNISEVSIPVGQWGLVNPAITLYVRMTIDREHFELAQEFPLRIAVPRLLTAGASVSRTVCIDRGRIAAVLAGRPLSECKFEVEAVLDPVVAATGVRSSLVTIDNASCSFMRHSLVAEDNPESYNSSLSELVASLRGDDMVSAMRAADLTVSLLKLSNHVQRGLTLPAGKVAVNMRRPELLAMLKYCLQESDAAIRLRTLSQIDSLADDELVLALAGPCLSDSSPLVRIAAMKFIGATPQGREIRLLENFADNDPDTLVLEMAEVLQK